MAESGGIAGFANPGKFHLERRRAEMKQLLVLPVLLLTLLVASPATYADYHNIWKQKSLADQNRYLRGWFFYNKGDYEAALKVWEPLAEHGLTSAQIVLGKMYAEGQGVPQDYETAVKWYKLAAERGYADAQSKLGAMHAKGQGVPQDYVRAHMWWNIAVLQGYGDAKKNRNMVEEKMSPAQLETARKLAREWMEKHGK